MSRGSCVRQHRFYCGIDLHARTMHVCVLDHEGNTVFDRNLPCQFETLLHAIALFRYSCPRSVGRNHRHGFRMSQPAPDLTTTLPLRPNFAKRHVYGRIVY